MSRLGKWVLILIVVIGFVLRFYQLTQIPATLNPDEKFNGYLAYSLYKTGRDLDGNFFPLAIKSFGSWTLIGYPLLTIIPVAIWGLTDFSARFVGAVSGVVGILLIYLVAQRLFESRRVSLAAALFFAVSPWSIYFSRISHETGLGLTLFLAGLLFFLESVKTRAKRTIILSFVFFGLSLLTHFAYTIFTTATVAALMVIYGRKLLKSKIAWLGMLIFALFLGSVAFSIARGSIGELKDVSILNNRDIIYGRVDRFKGDKTHHDGDFLLGIHNKYLGVTYQLAQNYVASFSPTFLFDKGGESLMHNMGYFGQLYFVDLLSAGVGFAFMLWKRERFAPLVILWIAITPLSSIFTKDHPSSTRLFPMAGAIVMACAYGVVSLVNSVRGGIVRLVVGTLVVSLFLANFLIYLDFYFIHFNYQRARFLYFGYKEAAQAAQKYPNYKVAMIGPENFAFISFLFYNRYDPEAFRKEVVYYPETPAGFRFVKKFGRFEFLPTPDRAQTQRGVFYIDKYRSGDKKNIIALPGGEGVFTYFVADDLNPISTDTR